MVLWVERGFLWKIWNSFNFTLQVSMGQGVLSLRAVVEREVFSEITKERGLWRDTHQQRRIW